MERAFFQCCIFVLPDCMVNKEWLLIEVETIQRFSNVLKKHMFLEKDDGGRAVFGSILNHALLNMLIRALDNPF